MKSKYFTILFLGIIMISTCYSASKITSSANEYVASKPKSTVPSYNSFNNNVSSTTGDVTGTIEPSYDVTPNYQQGVDSSKYNQDKENQNNNKLDSNKTSDESSKQGDNEKNNTNDANESSSKNKDESSSQNNNKKETQKPSPTKKATKKPITTKKPSYENAPIQIPKIYSVSAPGKETLKSSDGNSTIDISNMSKGYIAVKYTGKNKKVKVQVKLDSNVYNYDLASDSKYDYFPLQLGNGLYTVNVLENISGTQYRIIQSESLDVKIKNKNNVFLYPNQYVWFTQSSNIVKKSAQICNNQKTTIKKISAIFNFVTSNVKYDYNKAKNVKSGYLPDVDEILASGKGICFDYAALFASMCRAQGIPTKLITGYVSPSGTYHAWNEVYTPEKGWITVSFYLKTSGFNLVDPTFYSNMDDKEAAEYIGNGGNYKNYHVY